MNPFFCGGYVKGGVGWLALMIPWQAAGQGHVGDIGNEECFLHTFPQEKVLDYLQHVNVDSLFELQPAVPTAYIGYVTVPLPLSSFGILLEKKLESGEKIRLEDFTERDFETSQAPSNTMREAWIYSNSMSSELSPVGPESPFGPRFGAPGKTPIVFPCKTRKSSKFFMVSDLNLLASDDDGVMLHMDPFDIPWLPRIEKPISNATIRHTMMTYRTYRHHKVSIKHHQTISTTFVCTRLYMAISINVSKIGTKW